MTVGIKRMMAVTFIVLGLVGEPLFDKVVKLVKDNVDIVGPSPVVVDEPSDSQKRMVKSVVDVEISKEHAGLMAPFFIEVANVIETDPGFLTTTGQFREFNIMAGAMNFAGQEIKGVYPNLGASIDEALLAAIGKENAPLSGDRRARLIDILRAISWGVSQ